MGDGIFLLMILLYFARDYKCVTFIWFFYMNVVVCRKEHWKMILNIQFYNSCCANRVDESMTSSCCSFLRKACHFVYDWYRAMVKHNINKVLDFLFCSKSSRLILTSPAIITSFLKCYLLIVFYLKVHSQV